MAAKLLHSLADDNPDLQKQLGCWTGIFQIFDGRNVLSGRRISGQSYKGLLPPGHSRLTSDSDAYNQDSTGRNSTKYLPDKRPSTESSRASFSSSSRSSSFSSLDCGRINQPEASSFDRIIFPDTPASDAVITQPSGTSRLGRHSMDFRDVVKDSVSRESHRPSAQAASREQGAGHVGNQKSSKHPQMNLKHGLPADLKESLRVLAKLREAPIYYKENEAPRSSFELNDGSDLKDAPRHSYDGRETSRLSQKIKDLPRLSLDSRERTLQHSSYDSKSTVTPRNMQRGSDGGYERVLSPNRSLTTQSRGASIVAKLMGLEALTDAAPSTTKQLGPIRTFSTEDNGQSSMPSKSADIYQSLRLPTSPKGSRKEPASPQWKNQDGVMKPVASSKFPMEPAPWKHIDVSLASQKQAGKQAKFSSIYSDIERKLKDVEFKPSGKDLRALKQIIETMQAKGLMGSTKGASTVNIETKTGVEKSLKVPEMNSGSLRRDPHDTRAIASMVKQKGSSTGSYSPIVIMKPARLVRTSVIPDHGLPGHRTNYVVVKDQGSNSSASERTAKDPVTKGSRSDGTASPSGKKTSSRSSGAAPTSMRSLSSPKENTPSSVGNSGSTSPRLMQRKLESDKRSRPPTPEASRRRNQSNNQPSESGSPGGGRSPKSNLQTKDTQLKESSSNSRILSCHGDHTSSQSVDSNSVVELTGSKRLTHLTHCQSSSSEASKCSVSGQVQGSYERLRRDDQRRDCISSARESSVPSPVSVLDPSDYREGSPSPVKHVPRDLGEGKITSLDKNLDDRPWDSFDETSSNAGLSMHSSEMSRQKLQSIDNLVQKLRRLNSTHDEACTDYIASLCEKSSPDHRYVSEILLASGLLLRDLSSSMGLFQLHPSGHPINPELFFVLEQTKAKTVRVTPEPEYPILSTPDPDKLHRKLMFDTVNEILARKFASAMLPPKPWFRCDKLSWSLNAQKLLRELCAEIDQLRPQELKCCSLEDDNDVHGEKQEGDGFLDRILCEDLTHRRGRWIDFYGDIPVVVLDIERSIFKDLVNEIVVGEAAGSNHTGSRHRRQLFSE
ncbi:LONGIFOLIA 2-like protein [Drosera capensis]